MSTSLQISVPDTISDIMPKALMALQHQGETPSVDQIIVWLIDGLGYDQLQSALDLGLWPHLKARLAEPGAQLRAIKTVHPSMTPVALASLLTGSDPACHGLLGQSLYHQGQTVNVFHADLPLAIQLAMPTIAEQSRKAGVFYQAVLEHRILEGALTKLLHHDTEHIVTYIRDSGLAVTLNQALEASPGGITYLYTSGIDAINHRRGAYGAEWRAEMSALDWHLGSMRAPQGRRVRLWITADHGHVAMKGLLRYSELARTLPWLPERPAEVGEAVSVNVLDMEALKANLKRLPVPVAVVPTRERVNRRYFGKGDVEPFLSRLGAFLLVPESGYAWAMEPKHQSLAWSHGGCEDSVMTIPWADIRI